MVISSWAFAAILGVCVLIISLLLAIVARIGRKLEEYMVVRTLDFYAWDIVRALARRNPHSIISGDNHIVDLINQSAGLVGRLKSGTHNGPK